MPSILPTIATILTVTALGWWLSHSKFVTQEQWNGLEHLSYQVFFPALVLNSLIKADLSSVPAVAFGATVIGMIVIAGVILVASYPLLRRLTGMSGPAFTSVFQGALRWNTFVAFGLVESLFGVRGLTLLTVAFAAIIPVINVGSVMVLQRYGSGSGGARFRPLSLLKNPFIWSSLLGLALNLSHLPVPGPLVDAAGMCGKASLAGALLLIGGGLKLADLGKPDAALLISSTIKLVLLPLLATLLARFSGISGADFGVLIICASVPTAGASYILARQMGGDARLMAAITTFQTLMSALTLPLMLLWLTR